MERYVLRNEPSIQEPVGNPIRSIVLDRVSGKYNLLDQKQTDLVLNASEDRIGKENIIEVRKPYTISINLLSIEGNIRIIDQESAPPKNVLSAPITVYQEVTRRCNLNCRDCYQGVRPSTDTLTNLEVFHLLNRYSQIGVFIVRFTGKEPTAHPGFLDFVREGKVLGLKMALNTNGIFDDNYRRELVKAGVSEAVVSLEGDEKTNDYIRGKGVYKSAGANIQGFVEEGVDTRINTTVSKKNIDQIEYVAHLAHKAGAYVSYIPMRNLGNATQRMSSDSLNSEDMRKIATDITKLRKKYKPTRLLTYFDVIGEESDYYHPMFQMKPCHARKNIFMDNEGNVYPCDHLVNLGDLFRGGNVRENDILYIWRQGEGLERYRNLEHNERCLGCAFFGKQCHGGCPSEYLVANGANTQTVRDRLCFQDDRL